MKNGKNNLVCTNDIFFENVKKVLQMGKKVKIPVKGNSMNVALRDGDMVVLEPLQQSINKSGVIVLAQYKGDYILHRVVHQTSDFMYLAGDANRIQIEKVCKKDVIGMVSMAFREREQISIGKGGYSTRLSVLFWGRYLCFIIDNVKK